MKKEKKVLWIMSWKFWFALATIIMFVAFTWSEKTIEEKQPSPTWSIGVESVTGLTSDYRKIDININHDQSGFILTHISKEGIKLHKLDWYGRLIEEEHFEHDELDSLRVIEIETVDMGYYIYLSDRKKLERLTVDATTLEVIDRQIVTEHSEHFTASGEIVIVGDDEITEIYDGLELIGTVDGYVNLKLLTLEVSDKSIAAALNAEDGGRFVIISDGVMKIIEATTVAEQKAYGYYKDIHIENGVITIASSLFDHLAPGTPTVMGIWQLDESTSKELSFRPFYHVRTDLDPIITNVMDNEVSYVLGALQTLDHINKGLSRYPQTRGGQFTNISKYTRDGDIMIDNSRLTITRNYPVGYHYFETPNGPVLLWADKVDQTTNIYLAGEGSEWISYAKQMNKTDYVMLILASIVAFANNVFFGLVTLITKISPILWVIVLVAVLALLYQRFAPFDDERKRQQVYYALILFTIGFKFYITAIDNSDFLFYGHIYPFLFGNPVVMIVLPLATSAYALWMLYLWRREHPYYTNQALNYSLFLGFEIYIYMFGFMTYFVSALVKNNFMM